MPLERVRPLWERDLELAGARERRERRRRRARRRERRERADAEAPSRREARRARRQPDRDDPLALDRSLPAWPGTGTGAGWGPLTSVGPHLQVQAREGFRGVVMPLDNGQFLVTVVPDDVLRPELGALPLLPMLMVTSALQALQRQTHPPAAPVPAGPRVPGAPALPWTAPPAVPGVAPHPAPAVRPAPVWPGDVAGACRCEDLRWMK